MSNNLFKNDQGRVLIEASGSYREEGQEKFSPFQRRVVVIHSPGQKVFTHDGILCVVNSDWSGDFAILPDNEGGLAGIDGPLVDVTMKLNDTHDEPVKIGVGIPFHFFLSGIVRSVKLTRTHPGDQLDTVIRLRWVGFSELIDGEYEVLTTGRVEAAPWRK